MDRLRALTVFVRVAQARSFSQGARELGMTPQAASKQVMLLERMLGVRLLHRTTQKVGLTREGELLLAQCQRPVESLEVALRHIDGDREQVAGVVRVAAPYSLAHRYVAPAIGEFVQAYPDVAVELMVGDHLTDVIEQGIDIGLRTGTLPDSSLVARRIAPLQLIVCAAPAYLERHGVPKSIAELERHRCTSFLHPRTGKVFPWEFLVDGEVETRIFAPFVATNDVDAEVEAVASGAAIGQFFQYAVAQHLRAGRLVPVLPQHVTERYGVFLYMPARAHVPRRNRLLADFLVQTLAAHPDFARLSLGTVVPVRRRA